MQIIYRLYQTIEKKGPVSADRVSFQKCHIIVTVKAIEFMQASMTIVVVNIVVSISTNWLAKCSSNISKPRGSNHRKTDESTRPQAECFYCFEVFGTLGENRSTSFWDDFSNETIKKLCSDTFFCIVLPKWKNDNSCSEVISQYYVTLLQHAWLTVLV